MVVLSSSISRDTSGSASQHSYPHNNTLSRNRKIYVAQVTPPHAPWEGQGGGGGGGGGGGQDMGGGVT